ncbi:cobalt ECF transporter T component CbiQ [Chrysosporum bergii ANA360D]|uniref:Cobalt ECF transporter T component CbiQ n=1 Tax=Chrysosporum bergii ANA360D TaxID=617107 RepID=A0AA43GSD4_9CYAN|nr:cobalt ECF transporter T component CbiQ [Chrysosporum bergii]MDH6060526.1 cobalt ECF transporter T component CbiQ [Chrysosporum bergii ANA360D]
MSLQIDTLAYGNKLRWLAPEQKLLFAIALLIISAFTHPLLQILIVIWMGSWTVVYAKIPLKIYLRLVYVASWFWLISLPALVINGVNIGDFNLVQNDSVFGFNLGYYYIYISGDGIKAGWTVLSRAMASLSCLYFVMLTIPFTELLQTLRRFGLPILLTDILLLMYRFIFILLNTAQEIWTAQQSRNGYCNFGRGMKSLSLLIGQLLRRTLENYRQVGLSLAARGFNGEFQVWHSHRYYFSKRYAIESMLGCVMLIGLAWS